MRQAAVRIMCMLERVKCRWKTLRDASCTTRAIKVTSWRGRLKHRGWVKLIVTFCIHCDCRHSQLKAGRRSLFDDTFQILATFCQRRVDLERCNREGEEQWTKDCRTLWPRWWDTSTLFAGELWCCFQSPGFEGCWARDGRGLEQLSSLLGGHASGAAAYRWREGGGQGGGVVVVVVVCRWWVSEWNGGGGASVVSLFITFQVGAIPTLNVICSLAVKGEKG